MAPWIAPRRKGMPTACGEAALRHIPGQRLQQDIARFPESADTARGSPDVLPIQL
jgi:hypothetical protein